MSNEEARESVESAFTEIEDNAVHEVFESLKQVEQQIQDKFGDPDVLGQTWALVSTADRDGTDQFDEDKLVAVLTGQGEDLYSGLANRQLSIAHSLVRGKIGTMIRTGAWMSDQKDIRPSEDPQRKSVIITVSYLSSHIFLLIRHEDGKIDSSVLNEAGYNEGGAGGHQKLVDAVLDFDYLPTALKQHEPEQYASILSEIIKNMEERTE